MKKELYDQLLASLNEAHAEIDNLKKELSNKADKPAPITGTYRCWACGKDRDLTDKVQIEYLDVYYVVKETVCSKCSVRYPPVS